MPDDTSPYRDAGMSDPVSIDYPFSGRPFDGAPLSELIDVDVQAVTLHRDGTFGVMFRREGAHAVECTCGWRATGDAGDGCA